MSALYPFVEHSNGSDIYVRLTPKSAHDRIQGIFYDTDQRAYLKIAVTAPPVDGKANDALLKFLSKKLKCPVTSLSITRGHSDRKKTVFAENQKSLFLQQTLLP